MNEFPIGAVLALLVTLVLGCFNAGTVWARYRAGKTQAGTTAPSRDPMLDYDRVPTRKRLVTGAFGLFLAGGLACTGLVLHNLIGLLTEAYYVPQVPGVVGFTTVVSMLMTTVGLVGLSRKDA